MSVQYAVFKKESHLRCIQHTEYFFADPSFSAHLPLLQ